MKRFLWITWLILTSLLIAGDDPTDIQPASFTELAPETQHRKVSRLVAQLLMQNHYQKKAINDSLSAAVLDSYIEKLDYSKFYFLQSDIDGFQIHRTMFDDYIRSGQVGAAFDIFNVYLTRFQERLDFAFGQIERGFDFTLDEYFDKDREDVSWAATPAELDDLWRLRLKEEALDLKLAGKDEAGYKEVLTKRYRRIEKNMSQTQSEDVFQLVMNAFTETFDPHTNYFSPKNFDDFKIRMSQSLEGIGARLVTESDYTKVVEIVPGGPADRSKDLHPNDRITGVGQDVDGEIVDVIGWRIDDVVQLIRGAKNTVVRLQVLRADAAPTALPDTIALVRDKIKLEDQSAKSELLQVEHDGREMTFGVISIPVFYADYEAMRRGEPDFKSTSRDVKRFLNEFAAEDIDGVIIDLRRNGGGFLSEAVDLTGLFIDKGPVVQVRNTTGRVEVERDTDPSVVYDGPLAVVIDRLSASASEIFAAAIQDYQRGIVIGSQSYGKGTVQNAIDLNRFIRDPLLQLGQLKLTVAKFYRVDGRSTQHVGVTPDVTFPDRLSLMEIGESARDNALMYDKIDRTDYALRGTLNEGTISVLSQRHKQRLAADAEYEKLLANLEDFEKNRDQTRVSLNEATRRAEMAGTGKNEETEPEDSPHSQPDDEEKRDLLLDESAHVLADYILLSQR